MWSFGLPFQASLTPGLLQAEGAAAAGFLAASLPGEAWDTWKVGLGKPKKGV